MKQITGPILIIEDDEDDQQLLQQVFKELNYPNEVLYFSDGYAAYSYIESCEVKPFVIMSDILCHDVSNVRKLYFNLTLSLLEHDHDKERANPKYDH